MQPFSARPHAASTSSRARSPLGLGPASQRPRELAATGPARARPLLLGTFLALALLARAASLQARPETAAHFRAGARQANASEPAPPQPAASLHLGAKLALLGLALTLLLVLAATALDLRQEAAARRKRRRPEFFRSSSSLDSGGQQARPGQRDQRSPSLSSASSSSLFSSANSLGSASAPILGRPPSPEKAAEAPARQLLLCFSLRLSAAIIFKGANETKPESGLQETGRQASIESLHGLRFLSMIWIILIHSYNFALRWNLFQDSPQLAQLYKSTGGQLLANGTFACDTFLFVGGFLLAYLAFPARTSKPAKAAPASLAPHTNEEGRLTVKKLASNLLHRYIRMMPLMMALIGLSASLLRYLGEGPRWADSTLMFDGWCRENWWLNALFLHNFLRSQRMCLSHSWYSAIDFQLFLAGQLLLFVLWRSRRLGLSMLAALLALASLLTGALTFAHRLPAVPLLAGYSQQAENLYFSELYVKPYCRAAPYLIGLALAYLMRTSALAQLRLSRLQVAAGWTLALASQLAILLAMQPAMAGLAPSPLQSALYSSLSRPLWACATGWMVFACATGQAGPFRRLLAARAFVPLSRLTYPAFLVHPIIMGAFYGSRPAQSLQFSHYLMLYLVLGNVVITYASAFLLSALFELPLLSLERAVKRLLPARAQFLAKPEAGQRAFASDYLYAQKLRESK